MPRLAHVLAPLLLQLPAATMVGAQAPAPQPTQAPASCAAEFAWVEGWARENYAGYEDKVARSSAAHDSLLRALRPRAAAATTASACDVVLREWVASFHDGHLSIGRPRAAQGQVTQAGTTPDEVRARFADWPRVAVSEDSARARLAGTSDPMEGIFESLDGAYRVALLRDAGAAGYTMSILRADSAWWMPGQVKARLTRDGAGYAVRFFMRDHSEQAWTATVAGNVLRFSTGSAWLRTWPARPGDLSRAAYRAMNNLAFHAREIAPGTMLVQVPTFNDARGMDSLMAAEGARIRAAERLVIDVRGNGGGSDYNFRELTPLLYTGPVHLVSIAVLATEANNAANALLAADTTLPEGQRAQIRASLDRVRDAGTRWYEYDDRVVEGTVLPTPRHVAILVDRGCASSCEQFLLTAVQSAKVRIFGTNSAGILDYGNVRRADMPGSTLTLWHPTTRSKRVPAGQGIDNVGIPPHEPIPADVVDPITWAAAKLAAMP